MSAKTQFLKKLQVRQSAHDPLLSKQQADIAEFRQKMVLLQEQIEVWLTDTGLDTEQINIQATDLLVEGGTFEIPGIALRYERRTMKFLPIFLYGHGVTGCVEITLHADAKMVPQGRLWMRAGNARGWTFSPQSEPSRSAAAFDEDAFFSLIAGLLP